MGTDDVPRGIGEVGIGESGEVAFTPIWSLGNDSKPSCQMGDLGMIRQSTSIKFLVMALNEFHEQTPQVVKDSLNPHFKNKFASLGAITKEVDPYLHKVGLVLTQWPSTCDDGSPGLDSHLAHVSGEWMACESPLVMDKDNAQGQGSGLTYLKRYAACGILQIVADEDDDANAAARASKPKSRARPSEPIFVPPTPPLGDQLEESVRQVKAERAEPPSTDLATSKQLGYLKRLLDEGGYAPSEWSNLIDSVAPPAPEWLHNLTKGQAGILIDHLASK